MLKCLWEIVTDIDYKCSESLIMATDTNTDADFNVQKFWLCNVSATDGNRGGAFPLTVGVFYAYGSKLSFFAYSLLGAY